MSEKKSENVQKMSEKKSEKCKKKVQKMSEKKSEKSLKKSLKKSKKCLKMSEKFTNNVILTCSEGGKITLQTYAKFSRGKTVMAIFKGVP